MSSNLIFTERDDKKTAAVLDKKLIMFKKDEMKPILSFVKNYYGKDFKKMYEM